MKSQSIHDLTRALRWAPYPMLLMAALGAAVTGTAAQLAVPLVVARIIDGAVLESGSQELARWALLLAGLVVLGGFLRSGEKLAFVYLEQRALVNLRTALLHHLYRLPVSFFDQERSGRLNALFMTDGGRVGKLYNPILGDATLNALQLVGVLVVVAFKFGWMVLVPVLLIPLYISIPSLLASPTQRASRRAAEAHAETTAAVQESIDLVREIKAFTLEVWNSRRVVSRFGTALRRQLRLNMLSTLYSLSHIVYMLSVAFLYWFGGRQVQADRITVGEVIALVWYVGLLAAPANHLVTLQANIQTALGSAGRIFEFLDSQPETDAVEGGEILRRGKVSVVFEDVRFTYPGGRSAALDGVSFHAGGGERIAIVGPSGGGKSTLVHLLLRFYEPQEGRVLIEGRDVRRFRLDSLRRQVSLVSQEPLLFSVSVRDNIRLGRPDASEAEIERAAHLANAHDFIQVLPGGYDTGVGERGARLSVGQKQRLALARVVLRDPSILILDEATSALDAESEHLVREALERLMSGRTSFIIAHRMASIEASDRILVLDQGRLVAQGRHSELMESSSLYRRFVALQTERAGEGAPAELAEAG